jgi:hypothetical protein
MTRLYESHPVPHRLDIVCPACRHCAEFEFAEVVGIKLKSDVAFFQESSVFEYRQYRDSYGHVWHGALYFQGLHGSPGMAIHALPEGYSAEDWDHPRHERNRHGWRAGSIRCSACHMRGTHALNWPGDAYFSVAYRGHVLWAFHRESAVALMRYLLSTDRKGTMYGWATFLLHVPTVFKVRKASEAVARKLGKLLDPSHGTRRVG